MQNKYIKLFSFTVISLLSQSAISSGAKLPADLQVGWNKITQASLRTSIDYLTADQRSGRLALTQGNAETIDWIANQFKQAGLAPANGDSYLQTFNVISYQPDKKRNVLTVQKDSKRVAFKKPEIMTDYPSDMNVSGEVVFAGFGITAPDLHYDDYKNIDVKGKFVLVFEHEPQETKADSIFNGTGNTPYATNRVKRMTAQQHGAIGVIIVPEANRKHLSNIERYHRIGGSEKRKVPLPSMVLQEDDLTIPVVVLTDKAGAKLAAPLDLKKLQAAIDHDLTPQSQLIPNTRVELQERIKSSKVGSTSNVAGLLQGSDPSLQAETIIISAHHDHNGQYGKQIWHGADDNASGTAGVVELAAAIAANASSANGLKPKRSILFVVFAAEERGLLGSYYMASHPLRPLATTRALINFDMIGRNEKNSRQTKGMISIPLDTKNRLNLVGAHFSPDYDKVVRTQNQYVGLNIDDRFDYENALNALFRSDQFPFLLQGVPAIWWFTGFHPDYHHTTDTAEKINYQKMQKILRLAYLSAYEFANNASPPVFVSHPGA
jgi:hypothetical protein